LKKDKQEWTNTKMIFEIKVNGDKTIIDFTHKGLVPEKECYDLVEKGWTMIIKDYLYNYITNGKVADQLYE
ncbi:MAG TPA: SRPBCC domain-containing protein, partial [Puia sp.]